MNSIDWVSLRWPLLSFVIAVLVSAALGFVGMHFEDSGRQQYDQAVSSLRATHRQYRELVNDIDLLEQYRNRYTDYKASGLVGKERRLSWIESLEATNGVLRLPTLTYNLLPQEDFDRPGFKAGQGVAVNSSPMELTMGLLHEEDLFALLEGLRLSISNLYTVDSCSVNRESGVERSLDTRRTNLRGKCTIRWVTIDAG